MAIRSSICAVTALCAAHGVAAQPVSASPQVIAQAYDRCMTTYAVRLTRTDARDDDIFAQATQSCQPLGDQLTAAINAQLPPAQATELLQTMDARAKPDFMALLARIRSDRQKAAGG